MNVKVKLKSETHWVNVMPSIGQTRSPESLEIVLDPEEILPEGDYELEVTLKGTDGQPRTASARLRVSHAH
ncbi:hypothetical protein KKH15_02500 [Patescibacteria group bacterium]|nr:hypothetical protein [Patescibacteria group bacterium]